jgi:hypothetical protein
MKIIKTCIRALLIVLWGFGCGCGYCCGLGLVIAVVVVSVVRLRFVGAVLEFGSWIWLFLLQARREGGVGGCGSSPGSPAATAHVATNSRDVSASSGGSGHGHGHGSNGVEQKGIIDGNASSSANSRSSSVNGEGGSSGSKREKRASSMQLDPVSKHSTMKCPYPQSALYECFTRHSQIVSRLN